MAAPILLSEYKMRKKQTRESKRESEIPVTMAFMREFRAEILSRFDEVNERFNKIDARFDGLQAQIDGTNARLDGMQAQINIMNAQIEEIQATVNEGLIRMDVRFHEAKLIAEEQNLRNRQAYDSYAITEGALQDLKRRIRPECLE